MIKCLGVDVERHVKWYLRAACDPNLKCDDVDSFKVFYGAPSFAAEEEETFEILINFVV